MDVKQYIENNWDKTVRQNKEDVGDLIGLPLPYTVPCCEGAFQSMYYWDTFFTNEGLILSGKIQQAKDNANNICYLINKFGFMPNGNRTHYLSRSQPPFLSKMVRAVYEKTKDKDWLATCFLALEKEYDFWQTRRKTPTGLQHYYGDFSQNEVINFGHVLCQRFDMEPPKDQKTLINYGKAMFAFAESGWDCNSRMGLLCHECNWVDLNALLYGVETDMAFFADELCNAQQGVWIQRANSRKAAMESVLWNEEIGAFCDYNFETKSLSSVVSAAQFYPLFVGLCNQTQAKKTKALLQKIEMPFGVSCCEEDETLYGLQWDYPNGWACLQYVVVHGLLRYGYQDDAIRIAKKYVSLVESVFEKTGKLWEKYNVTTGEVSKNKEYETPEMMGWSAGVYMSFCNLLNK